MRQKLLNHMTRKQIGSIFRMLICKIMQGEILHIIVWMFVVLLSVASLTMWNKNLNEIPWDLVPDTETKLSVRYNRLRTIWVPVGKQLQTLTIGNNLFTTFPDLVNISGTLQKLLADKNCITHIHPPILLQQLGVLKHLYIATNCLVALPDTVYLPPRLVDIRCQDNNMKSILNMCYLNMSQRQNNAMKYTGRSNPYFCESKTVWTKVSLDLGIVELVGSPQCASPSSLTGTQLQNITKYDVVKQESGITYQRLADPGTFFCYPRVTVVTPGVTKTTCGTKCLEMASCLMFAVDGGQCVLTEFIKSTPGTRESFEAYTKWYIIK